MFKQRCIAVEGVEHAQVWFSERDALSRFETGPGHLVVSGDQAGESHGYHEYHEQ